MRSTARAVTSRGCGRARTSKAAAGANGLRYDALARLQLKPGRYEIRVAVQHRRAGRLGSVYAYVDVPDFAKSGPWLSGVVLAGPLPCWQHQQMPWRCVSGRADLAARVSRAPTISPCSFAFIGAARAPPRSLVRARIIDAESTDRVRQHRHASSGRPREGAWRGGAARPAARSGETRTVSPHHRSHGRRERDSST